MTLELEIQDHDDHIHAVVTGRYSEIHAIDLFRKILIHCEEVQISRILIDCRKMGGKPSTINNYNFAKKTTEIWKDHNIEGKCKDLKLVYLLNEFSFDPHQLGETVAFNRGVDFALVTKDLDEAMEWLGKDE